MRKYGILRKNHTDESLDWPARGWWKLLRGKCTKYVFLADTGVADMGGFWQNVTAFPVKQVHGCGIMGKYYYYLNKYGSFEFYISDIVINKTMPAGAFILSILRLSELSLYQWIKFILAYRKIILFLAPNK